MTGTQSKGEDVAGLIVIVAAVKSELALILQKQLARWASPERDDWGGDSLR